MGKPADRDPNLMRAEHGTSRLVTDYGALDFARKGIERYNEALKQLTIDPAAVRNSDDYDDWDYGTEPIPGDDLWARKNQRDS
jgi:hypothetical protein